MPVKSYLNGSYRLVAAIESSSRANTFYRVLQDTATLSLSCDCPRWIMNGSGNRTCKHTDAGQRLLTPLQGTRAAAAHQLEDASRLAAAGHPLVEATRTQWQGIATATWGIEERDSSIGADSYHFVLLRVLTGDLTQARAIVAFANRHFVGGDRYRRMVPGVAGWAGYELCSQVARAAGNPRVGQPPEHFMMHRRAASARPARAQPGRLMDEPEYGLADLLRVGERTNLGDGLTPNQRAEATLRMFLGPLYEHVETRGFIDVPSLRVPNRVYRVRRDVKHRDDRRVRVIQNGYYTNDLCIVRAQDVPEADHVLTVFLRLCSDEQGILSVVHGQEVIGKSYAARGNVFPPHSEDSYAAPREVSTGHCLCEFESRRCPRHLQSRGEPETEPAVWRPRTAAAVA